MDKPDWHFIEGVCGTEIISLTRIGEAMRKIFFQMMLSVDGFFEGPNREIDWHNVDDEFNDYAIEMLNKVDLLIFGRITYDLMNSYWPTKEAMTNDPIVAGLMNSLPKIVYSKTIEKAEWNNTRLVKEVNPDEILKIKNEPGKDIAVFGSSDLVITLNKHRLIDEFRIFINPLILGSGKALLKGITTPIKLKFINTRTFSNGNVLLCYEPI